MFTREREAKAKSRVDIVHINFGAAASKITYTNTLEYPNLIKVHGT